MVMDKNREILAQLNDALQDEPWILGFAPVRKPTLKSHDVCFEQFCHK